MIDTKELRRLVQAATPGPWEVAYTDQNGQAVVKGEHIEIATCWHHCVGSIEKEMYANAALIAAANPAAISGLLDRLEAAEKDIALKEKLIDALGLGLNAAAHERDNLRAEVESWKGLAQQFGNELDTVRAKIAEMEKQEPVWFIDERGEPKRYHKSKADYCKYGGLDLLYTLPGAKGEKDV